MTPAEGGLVRVSVVYLTPRLAFRRVLSLPSPATVGEAIEASGVRREVPELAASEPAVGVFGQSRSLADALHDGDRVEVYRPLTIDPKQARRVRVAVRRRRKTAAGAGRD